MLSPCMSSDPGISTLPGHGHIELFAMVDRPTDLFVGAHGMGSVSPVTIQEEGCSETGKNKECHMSTGAVPLCTVTELHGCFKGVEELC